MTDFASVLFQAQSSGAQVIALGSTRTQGVTSVKQAKEFGLGQHETLVGPSLLLSEVRNIGLEIGQGLLVTDSFDLEFERPHARVVQAVSASAMVVGCRPARRPASIVRSSTICMRVTRSVQRRQGDRGKDAVTPVDDFMTDNARIQPDGWVERKFYLFEVKKPSEFTGEWDVLKLAREIPAAEVAPVNTGCPLR